MTSTGLDPWRPVLTEVGRREESVLSKPQNLRLWQGGELGNKLRAWRTLDEWRASGFRVRVALRTLAVGGGPCYYDLGPEEVEETYLRLLDSGTAGQEIMICEMAPAESAVLQGEYRNGAYDDAGEPAWGYFYYSHERRHMREALAERSSVARGLRSDLLLWLHMSPGSYEDWRELLERYPEHVLEISVYDRYLGDVPRRNALVWEVRRY